MLASRNCWQSLQRVCCLSGAVIDLREAVDGNYLRSMTIGQLRQAVQQLLTSLLGKLLTMGCLFIEFVRSAFC